MDAEVVSLKDLKPAGRIRCKMHPNATQVLIARPAMVEAGWVAWPTCMRCLVEMGEDGGSVEEIDE